MRKVLSLLLCLAPLALLPLPSQAAQKHSEDWCADAVDFAMSTAEYRDLGRTHAAISKSITADAEVFHQQFPDLSTADMHRLADTVFAHHWSRFTAASETSKICRPAPEPEPAALLTAEHSDEWCANAVGFSMGVAQNRELEYTHEVMSASYDQNPSYYHMQYPELTREEMLGLTDEVYRRQWTRYAAAASVSGTCKASLRTPPKNPAAHTAKE